MKNRIRIAAAVAVIALVAGLIASGALDAFSLEKTAEWVRSFGAAGFLVFLLATHGGCGYTLRLWILLPAHAVGVLPPGKTWRRVIGPTRLSLTSCAKVTPIGRRRRGLVWPVSRRRSCFF